MNKEEKQTFDSSADLCIMEGKHSSSFIVFALVIIYVDKWKCQNMIRTLELRNADMRVLYPAIYLNLAINKI